MLRFAVLCIFNELFFFALIISSENISCIASSLERVSKLIHENQISMEQLIF